MNKRMLAMLAGLTGLAALAASEQVAEEAAKPPGI